MLQAGPEREAQRDPREEKRGEKKTRRPGGGLGQDVEYLMMQIGADAEAGVGEGPLPEGMCRGEEVWEGSREG